MARQKTKVPVGYDKGLVWITTGLALPEEASPELVNVEFYRGITRRARGFVEFSSSALVGRVLVLTQYIQWDGTAYLLCITDDEFYKFVDGTQTFTKIGDYTGTDGRFVSTEVFNDLFIFTDGENNVQKWDGTTQADLGDLTNILGKVVTAFNSHLLLGYTIESGTINPARVRWSDTADPENWSSGNSGFVDLVDTPGEIVNIEILRDRVYVYKTDSIWEGVYVGLPNIFEFTILVSDIGLAAPRSLTNRNNVHRFLGTDGIYRFDGNNFEDVVGNIRDLLYGSDAALNTEYLSTANARYVEELQEYWLAVAVEGKTSPEDILRYHEPSKGWWLKKYALPIYCFGDWQEDVGLIWNNAPDVWQNYLGIWKSSTLSKGFPLTLFGTFNTSSEGKTGKLIVGSAQDSATWPTAYWCTKDFSMGARTRWTEFWVEAQGSDSLTLSYSTDEGLTWTNLGAQSVGSSWAYVKWTFDVTVEIIRFKIGWGDAEIYLRKRVAWMTVRRR